MGAILSGMALHKGLRPYGGTFLTFSDYMKPSIRLAALMEIPVIYIFTHDSIGLGEDGPTHQSIEHLSSLRGIPNLTVIRPADATETAEAWRHALSRQNGPTALVLSRQNLAVIDRTRYAAASGLEKGAYILSDSEKAPEVSFIATGSEVELALAAKDILETKGVAVRVVSMPSWELFEKNGPEYRNSILFSNAGVKIAVETGVPMGWERYTGSSDAIIGISGYGASAPGDLLMEKYGFTAENVVERAMQLLNNKSSKPKAQS
jgi:transketolase